MGRFVMKQKWFSFGDDFSIRDAEGRDAYHVDGKVFSIGDQLTLQDPSGRPLALIDQKLLSWGPTYEIWKGNHLAAVVKKSVFTFFRCEFTVDVPGPDDLLAEGDFWEHEYTFNRGGRPVASVSKKYFSWTDTYGIDIRDGEDAVLLLASVVVIDLCCHQDRK